MPSPVYCGGAFARRLGHTTTTWERVTTCLLAHAHRRLYHPQFLTLSRCRRRRRRNARRLFAAGGRHVCIFAVCGRGHREEDSGLRRRRDVSDPPPNDEQDGRGRRDGRAEKWMLVACIPPDSSRLLELSLLETEMCLLVCVANLSRHDTYERDARGRLWLVPSLIESFELSDSFFHVTQIC